MTVHFIHLTHTGTLYKMVEASFNTAYQVEEHEKARYFDHLWEISQQARDARSATGLHILDDIFITPKGRR